jgi:hypothetical protein
MTFPSSPTLNQTYTSDGRTWYWNGYAWKASGYVSGVVSATSPITYDSNTKVVGLDRTAENTVNDTRYALLADNQLYPIDTPVFDGLSTRFIPTYQGTPISVANPYKLLIFINGIAQKITFPEYVWQSGLSKDGFMVDLEGYISFTEPIPAGATFDGRVLPGAATVSTPSQYPFNAADILLGA